MSASEHEEPLSVVAVSAVRGFLEILYVQISLVDLYLRHLLAGVLKEFLPGEPAVYKDWLSTARNLTLVLKPSFDLIDSRWGLWKLDPQEDGSEQDSLKKNMSRLFVVQGELKKTLEDCWACDAEAGAANLSESDRQSIFDRGYSGLRRGLKKACVYCLEWLSRIDQEARAMSGTRDGLMESFARWYRDGGSHETFSLVITGRAQSKLRSSNCTSSPTQEVPWSVRQINESIARLTKLTEECVKLADAGWRAPHGLPPLENIAVKNCMETRRLIAMLFLVVLTNPEGLTQELVEKAKKSLAASYQAVRSLSFEDSHDVASAIALIEGRLKILNLLVSLDDDGGARTHVRRRSGGAAESLMLAATGSHAKVFKDDDKLSNLVAMLTTS